MRRRPLRPGDAGSMGRILVAGEHGNGIVDELAPLEVGPATSRCWHCRRTPTHALQGQPNTQCSSMLLHQTATPLLSVPAWC